MSVELDAVAARVVAALDALGARYELLPCDPDFADTAAFCERYGVPLGISANTIVVASRRPPGVHAACVVLADRRLDVNHAVRSLLGVRKLSFASAQVTRELTGMLIGGVSPFGLPEGLRLLVDAAVLDPEVVVVGGGSRSLKVKVDPEVFARMPGAEVVEGLSR